MALPELGTSVFVIPGWPRPYPDGRWPVEKNKEDQLVVLNKISRSVVDACRGNGSPYVFTYKEQRARNCSPKSALIYENISFSPEPSAIE